MTYHYPASKHTTSLALGLRTHIVSNSTPLNFLAVPIWLLIPNRSKSLNFEYVTSTVRYLPNVASRVVARMNPYTLPTGFA